ncbi:hypothetical protein TSH100_30210 [Azospirillum sp. TSH100]|uniref:hypothetical protein n=1 Tax=Azospirillum sp. TSH100 TaxID=652764 RepID=UPI000D61678B|nr:hypothetical protein [Azospirillum sp. TSH100]PWC80213.1 hypothetical protein TSH100_30210 [Azospirillum sp. TSH100]QCG90035.1 hypothetical protein E6C72_19885 [Azospirillum sp. TSH100]
MKTPNLAAAAAAGTLTLLVSACASTLSPPPMAQPDPALLAVINSNVANDCNPQTASVLTGLRLPPGNIRGVNYGIYRDMFRDAIVRWDAWVYLKDQPGALVVTLDEDCRPIQVYAREGAKLPGQQ